MLRLFSKTKKNGHKTGEAAVDPAAKFLEDYETEEQELIILLKEFTKGGMVRDDFLFPAVSFLAYIDKESGRAIQEKGTLCWVIRRSSNNYIHKFKDYGIYKVLVRKMKPGILNPLGQPFKNRYYIVKILEKNVKEPQLEKILTEYLKPVYLKDDLGTFHLERKYDWFEGQINWAGSMKNVMLDKDEDSDTAKASLQTLHMLMDDMEKWDRKLREYAGRELAELANDWQDKESPVIGEEEFAERIGCPSFHIDNKGDFEAEYNDDDMFYGHWIVIRGACNGELTEAIIEG